MYKAIGAAFTALTITLGGTAYGSSLPAVDGDYHGNYFLQNAFDDSHGLWLPYFVGDGSWDDNAWSIKSGSAKYEGNNLSLYGTAVNEVDGVNYSLDFAFSVYQVDHAGGLYCGRAACSAVKGGPEEQNAVFFDMADTGTMGTIWGTAGTILDGVEIGVTMRPLPDKPGQLGYGGNWVNADFGYSNWLEYEVLANSTQYGKSVGYKRNGDVNLDLIATPLPAGLPLVLTGALGFYFVRRKQKAAS